MPGTPGRTRKSKNHRNMRQAKVETTETKTKDNQAHNLRANQSLTPEQRSIVNRALAETAEWETIGEESMNDFSLSISPLDLKHNFPEAWKEQNEKRYAFRWCERTDKRIDELTRGGHPITRWKLCTKTTTPFLERYVDSIIGCVARLDQALLYRPWNRHMMEKNAKNQIAEAHANAGKPENVALKRASEKIEAHSGPEYKIGSKDEAVYEDTRSANEEVGDLVVEE